MIYFLWLFMFGVLGAICFVLTAFFSGTQTQQTCVLLMVLLLVVGWMTAEFIDEVESKKKC
jgi:ABC-type Na+ efflux pump permease subunit